MSNSANNSLVDYSPSAESIDNQQPTLLPLIDDNEPTSSSTSSNDEPSDIEMSEACTTLNNNAPKALSIENAIKQLRDQVERLTVASVTTTDKEQFNKNHLELKAVKAKLRYALDSQKLIRPTKENAIVPSSLPLIQWRGGPIQNENAIIFENVNAALCKFVAIIQSYGLNVNWHFKRLLPTCLNVRMNAWLSEYIKCHQNACWEDVKNAMIEKYGVLNDKMQQTATNKLINVKMYQSEDIDEFIDRFNVLRSEARVFEEHMLCQFYLSALPPRLSQQLSMFNATASEKKRNKIKYLMEDSQRLYNCMENANWRNEHCVKKRSTDNDNQNEMKKPGLEDTNATKMNQ